MFSVRRDLRGGTLDDHISGAYHIIAAFLGSPVVFEDLPAPVAQVEL